MIRAAVAGLTVLAAAVVPIGGVFAQGSGTTRSRSRGPGIAAPNLTVAPRSATPGVSASIRSATS